MTFDRYDFDSWREFSYLDEENLESAQRSAVSSARELYRLLILMKYVGQKVFKWGGGGGVNVTVLWVLCSILYSREERRWMEKQNKTVRQKRKKEDMARIRTLVGIYYSDCLIIVAI